MILLTNVEMWVSGIITDIESFLVSVEPTIKADLAPIWANIQTEFMNAEGKFVPEVYAAFKLVLSQTFASVKAANPGASVFELVKLVAEAALPALKSGGITLAESALIQFVTSLLLVA